MRTLDLTLTLVDDLVASRTPATEGGHASLEYPTGSALLGAAAARLYGKLSHEEAHTLFHSGRVRFGDGYPFADELPHWPMPLCWHERKNDPNAAGQPLDPGKVRNFQFGHFDDGAQPKQLRAGYVARDGVRVHIAKSLRMKTSIDPKTGSVMESQLFGYDAIAAGQTFVARVEADSEVPDALWKKLADALTNTQEVLLGRSRSAEYGRVRIAATDIRNLYPETADIDNTLTLWCLSDLALIDEWGQPSLEPTPERLGLGAGAIDWSKSFLRFRRYAPWNAYRRAYDVERQVIQRGSVVSLTLDNALSEEQRQRLAAGVGLHLEAGLGRLCLNPRILAKAQPQFVSALRDETEPAIIPEPDHPLIAWLRERSTGGTRRHEAEAKARKGGTELKHRYRLARAFAGVPPELPIGPSPAQWGRVYERARTSGDLTGIRRSLFEGDDAICKSHGEGWQDQFRDDAGVRHFVDWLRQAIDGLESVHALRAFAREAQRIAKIEHGRANEGGRTA